MPWVSRTAVIAVAPAIQVRPKRRRRRPPSKVMSSWAMVANMAAAPM
jgi:hypothetical protein